MQIEVMNTAEEVFDENKLRKPLFQKSGSLYPIAMGNCFEINRMPIAANIPLITADGK